MEIILLQQLLYSRILWYTSKEFAARLQQKWKARPQKKPVLIVNIITWQSLLNAAIPNMMQ